MSCILQQDTKILLQLRDQCEPRWRQRPGQRLDAEQVSRDILHPSGGDFVSTMLTKLFSSGVTNRVDTVLGNLYRALSPQGFPRVQDLGAASLGRQGEGMF